MDGVYELKHPLIQHKLTLMRKKETSTNKFRTLMREVAMLVGYEVTRQMALSTEMIETPLERMEAPVLEKKKMALISIMRAGNGLLDGMLALMPTARVGHIGLYREVNAQSIVEYYFKVPQDISQRDALVLDPMLATGQSAVIAVKRLKEYEPKNIRFVCLLASPEGIEQFQAHHPDVPIYTAAVDRGLNEDGYIVPGIGDAETDFLARSETSSQLNFTVPKSLNETSIDKALVILAPDLSRRQIRRALDAGGIFLQGKRVDRASAKVKTGMKITLSITKDVDTVNQFQLNKKDVLYFQDDLIAINKPPHIAVQKGQSSRAQNIEDLVISYGKSNHLFTQAFICHRLDKDTTGVLLLSNSRERTAEIMELFKAKTIQKTYWALTYGVPKVTEWAIKNHLSDIDKKTAKVSVVKSGGKVAITTFKLLKQSKNGRISLIECSPLTGRSHQLRVHLATSGLPILGDKKYGIKVASQVMQEMEPQCDHHLLHAKSLRFSLENEIEITAPLPKTFQKILDKYF